MQHEPSPTIYSPEFIPYYVEIEKKYQLSSLQTLLYGFIRFFLKSSERSSFYFSNEQLATMLGKRPTIVSVAINKLSQVGLLELEYRMKADGGKIRFIQLTENCKSNLQKSVSLTYNKVYDNNNKIKDNKIKDIYITEARDLVDKFNTVFEKNPPLKSVAGFVGNLQYWHDQGYTTKDFLEAIENSKIHSFWGNKINLTILFRRKNPRGEAVDYIAEMLTLRNIKDRTKIENQKQIEQKQLQEEITPEKRNENLLKLKELKNKLLNRTVCKNDNP